MLYGAGGVGRDVCRVLTNAGIRVVCFLDRRASGDESYEGVPIYPIDPCRVSLSDRARIPIVLSIFNRDVDIPELAFSLQSLGFAQVASFVGLHAAFPDALGDRFWLTNRSHVTAHLAEVREAEKLWADDLSRAVYGSLMALRSTGRYERPLMPIAGETQYFPSDVPHWLHGGPLRMVDCGAYRGETLEVTLTSGRQVESSAHFEPDMENFASLAQVARERQRDVRGSVMLWPCAVSDRTGVVRFQEGRQEASRVTADGDASVPAVALDDVLVGWQPTFVKMDIEGSELDALLGSRALIAENRPSLAICVYHRPDHLWRIPLLLSGWAELRGYRYYLRAHAFSGFDTVLYACPGAD
jgi:FkbM family methyltransferase